VKAREVFEYNKLTWPEMNDAIELGKVVLLPTGSTEQHGAHLPLDTDLFLADRGAPGPAPTAGAAGDSLVTTTRRETLMRATRATRHGLRYTAGWCAMALALLLGATLIAAQPASAQSTLKVALQGDTSNVDLHLTTHYVSRIALLNVYEMLYTLGEDLSIQPMLAEKHSISPDALTYTITVRKGVKFHNGKVMDAKDVAYTLNRMRNQGCRSAEFKALVKDVEATDASTVRINLNAPSGVFLANLANVICPVVIYPEGEVEKQGGAITKPIGTGPFEFVEWKKDAYLRVKKFKDYVADPRPTSGLAGKKVALVDTVDFIPIPDSSVRAAAIEKGDVDVAIELNVEDVPRMKGKSGVVVGSIPGIAFDDLRFGFKKGPFTNQKLRQAVAFAIDKSELSQANTGGQGKPVSAGFPAGMPFHGAVHSQDPYAKRDIAKAKQLMQEAGYKGQEVVLTAHLVPDRIAQGAVILQSQLEEVGFKVKVLTLESAALQETFNKGDFELFYSGLTPRPDADVYYCQNNESKSSVAGYSNPEYDRLCQEGRKALKAEDRARIYAQLEQLRRADLPYYPTIYVPQVAAWRENVKGWNHWPAGYARVWGVSK
jgi:peptide/nickel transport system substrate-binding protein